MKIGFIGLGKLGLPVSVCIALKGHEIYGYDIDEGKRASYLNGRAHLHEPDIDNLLRKALESGLHLVNSYKEIMEKKLDIIFVAVPTPSLPDNSFDTNLVEQVVSNLGYYMNLLGTNPVISIISTVLPGTMRNRIYPALAISSKKSNIKLCYNASFIAMGTTIADFEDPEFVLIGEDTLHTGKTLEDFYKTIVPEHTPILHMTWEEAETVKMSYNTFIGFKIVVANAIMEICQKIKHADVDIISNALGKATRRIVGKSYLRGGMGDGGGCHPRDQLALSWLAKSLNLSANPFEMVMEARERQSEWVANMLIDYQQPIVIMGKRYKPNTDLTDYSPSILVADLMKKKGVKSTYYDPLIGLTYLPKGPHTYLIALDEAFVHDFKYPPESIIIDVWRCFKPEKIREVESKNCIYIPVGRKKF